MKALKRPRDVGHVDVWYRMPYYTVFILQRIKVCPVCGMELRYTVLVSVFWPEVKRLEV